MYSLRYARALLSRKAKELGTYKAVADQMGFTFQRFYHLRTGRGDYQSGIGERASRYLGVRKVHIYIPIDMTEDELDARLAIARRGNANGA